MIIERNSEGIFIKTTEDINMAAVQKVIDYINILEITSQNKGTQEEAAAWADEVDSKWRQANKHRFSK